MRTEGRWLSIAVLAFYAGGCTDAEWTFRPRDGGRAMDVAGDTTNPRDDARVPPLGDGSPGDTGVTPGDVASDPDAVTADTGIVGTDSGVPLTGLVLRAQGAASSALQSASVGSLRLTETGFEFGSRQCVGPLCMVGGLIP